MSGKKKIVLAITNDPNYDQRMIRICTSLHNAGYDVTLVGRKRPNSKALIERPFKQVRIVQRIDSGKIFYLLFNLKLLFYLLFKKVDCFCAIDLDTILPVYYASLLRGKPRVYDAHELFCELEEVVSRPRIHKMWKWIEQHTVPNFKNGYTVNGSYVAEFQRMYGLNYFIVRNATVLRPLVLAPKPQRSILYQGAVNVGRCFEQLIPAMRFVAAPLVICGEGNFYAAAQALAKQHGVEDKIIFKGYVPPAALTAYTQEAYIGITLFVATSLSNELSLANRFFDYMHSAVPQLAMNYPEYTAINEQFEIAHLLNEVTPKSVAAALNKMLDDEVYYQELQKNCLKAREVYCWQEEEKRLLQVYRRIFTGIDQ